MRGEAIGCFESSNLLRRIGSLFSFPRANEVRGQWQVAQQNCRITSGGKVVLLPEMGTEGLETKNEHYSSLSAPFASLHTRKPKRCKMKGCPPSRLLHFALPTPSPFLPSPPHPWPMTPLLGPFTAVSVAPHSPMPPPSSPRAAISSALKTRRAPVSHLLPMRGVASSALINAMPASSKTRAPSTMKKCALLSSSACHANST